MRSFCLSEWRFLALGLVLAACGGARASSVPLGGTREADEPLTARPAASVSPGSLEPVAATTGTTEADEDGVEEVEVVATKNDAAPLPSASPAPAAAFTLKPYTTGQAWTRSFELEFNVKLGPGGGVEVRTVSHQEARFEVLTATAGSLDKLAIEYVVYTSKMFVMGNAQDSPEELAGKRYVITFPQGKPDVKDASGRTPSKKELDSVKDDAREPLETAKALKELAQLAAKGSGDFSAAGAIALAGGEDDNTKITAAKGSLRQVSTNPRGERSALLDLGYTLLNTDDEGGIIEAKLTGSVRVIDGPARYQTVTLQGPLDLRPPTSGGMAGSGSTKMTVTYRY